jgi:hypothetical protein
MRGEAQSSSSSSGARRCPDCGALASADAAWCGQCFRPLNEPVAPDDGAAEESRPPSIAARPADADAGSATQTPANTAARQAPTWPCPACGNANAIELDACAVCGTSFASLMRQDDMPPDVDPREAFRWSLAYPGLGHRKVGRAADGVARGVLFTIVFAIAILTALSGLSSPIAVGIFVVFLAMAAVVYVGSAYEAAHLASGGRPFVSARTLLWITVGVIMASVAGLVITVVSTVNR